MLGERKKLVVLLVLLLGATGFSGCIGGPTDNGANNQVNVQLSINAPDIYISAGETKDIVVYVNNTGDDQLDNVGAEVAGLDDFTIVLPRARNIYALDSSEFRISITPKVTADYDYTANITLASGDYRRTVNVVVHLLSPALSIDCASVLPLNSSEYKTFYLNVSNSGRGTARSARADIAILDNFTKVIPAPQDIRPAESKAFELRLTAPAVGVNSTFNATIEVRSGGAYASKAVTVNVSVQSSVSLLIGSIPDYNMSLGESRDAQITVSNTGNSIASGVTLALSNTRNLTVNSVSPQSQDIPAGASAPFTVNITAPSWSTEVDRVLVAASCAEAAAAQNNMTVRTAVWDDEVSLGEATAYSLQVRAGDDVWVGNSSSAAVSLAEVKDGYGTLHSTVNYSSLVQIKTTDDKNTRKVLSSKYFDLTTGDRVYSESEVNSTYDGNNTLSSSRTYPEATSDRLEHEITQGGIFVGENASDSRFSVWVNKTQNVTVSGIVYNTAVLTVFSKADNETTEYNMVSRIGFVKAVTTNETGAVTGTMEIVSYTQGGAAVTSICSSSHAIQVNANAQKVLASKYPDEGSSACAFKPAYSLRDSALASQSNATVAAYLSSAPNAVVSDAMYDPFSDAWLFNWDSATENGVMYVEVDNTGTVSYANRTSKANSTEEISPTQSDLLVTETSAIYLAEHDALFSSHNKSRYGKWALFYHARVKEPRKNMYSDVATNAAVWVIVYTPDGANYDAVMYINAENGKIISSEATNRHVVLSGPRFADDALFIQKDSVFYASDIVNIYYSFTNLKGSAQGSLFGVSFRETLKVYENSTNTLVFEKNTTKSPSSLASIPARNSTIEPVNTTNFAPGKYRAEATVEDLLDGSSETSTGYFYLVSALAIDRNWSSPEQVTSYDMTGEASEPCMMQDSSNKYWIAYDIYWYSWYDYDLGYYYYRNSGASVVSTINSTSPSSGWGDMGIVDFALSGTIDYFYASQPSMIKGKGGKTLVAFTYWGSGGGDILVSSSTDGVNWASPIQRLTNDTNNSDNQPCLFLDANGTYWLAWASNRTTGNYDIWLRNSTDGLSWSTPARVSLSTGNDTEPKMVQAANGRMTLTWKNTASGLVYSESNDSGLTWSNATQVFAYLSASYGYGYDYIFGYDIIRASDGNYWIAFEGYDSLYGWSDIYVAKSYNFTSWNLSQASRSHTDEEPDLMQDASGTIWLAWASNRSGYYDIWTSHRP